MSSIDGLCFYSRVPPGIKDEDVISSRQIEAQSTGFEADEEHSTFVIRLKVFNAFFSITCLPIKILVIDPLLIKVFFDDCQHTRELREDQRLVPFLDQFLKVRYQDIQFRTGFFVGRFVEQGGVASKKRESKPSGGRWPIEAVWLTLLQTGAGGGGGWPGRRGRAQRR